jgi:hypothetical protein
MGLLLEACVGMPMVVVAELSAEGVPAGQHGGWRGRGVAELRGRIAQPGQVAAQRRVQGAHEADVGWCFRLTGAVAGLQADCAADYQRCRY